MKREEEEAAVNSGLGDWWAAVAAAVACAGLTAGVAVAHDPSQHNAKAAHGVVARASGDAVTVMAGGKESTYTILPETKILRDGESLQAGDLTQGAHVEVYSTKLPGGTVAATEINLADTPRDGTGAQADTGHEHGAADGHVR